MLRSKLRYNCVHVRAGAISARTLRVGLLEHKMWRCLYIYIYIYILPVDAAIYDARSGFCAKTLLHILLFFVSHSSEQHLFNVHACHARCYFKIVLHFAEVSLISICSVCLILFLQPSAECVYISAIRSLPRCQ